HSLPDHRHGGGQRADGDGHDGALATDHFAAVQDHAVRADRWLGADHRYPRQQLRHSLGGCHDSGSRGRSVSRWPVADSHHRRRAGGAEPVGRPGGGDVPGGDADQRADAELSAAPAGDAADADLGGALAGARADGVQPEPDPEHTPDHRLMLELTNAQIGGWVAQFLLPLFRVAALLMSMPIIGTQLVPMRVRLYLAVALSVVLVPAPRPVPVVVALGLQALLLIVEQILIGVMLGFVLQLFFQLFIVSGQMLAMQMGLGFASMVDPANGVSVPVLGQFFNLLVILLFLAMNGH